MSARGGDSGGAPEADIDRIADDLAQRYQGILSRDTIAQYVVESNRLLTANGEIPLAASRTAAFATQRLDDVLRTRGRANGTPAVLFVCVQNVGRSQLASAMLKHLAGNRVIVRTAGSRPGREVSRTVVAVLDEIGVPIAGEFPKPLLEESVRAADVVVTMGCGDACPVLPETTYLDWPLPDPAGSSRAALRCLRDEIDGRVRMLLPALLGP